MAWPGRGGLVREVVGRGRALPLGGTLVVQIELELGVGVLEHLHSSRSVVGAVLDSSREGGCRAWGRCLIFGLRPPQLRVLGD
jgi:hypothetical protein